MHGALAVAVYVSAFVLRFDVSLPRQCIGVILRTLPLLVACKLLGFWSSDVLSIPWRHVSLRDVEAIVRGNLLAAALFLTIMVFGRQLGGFPRSVFPLDLLLSTGLMTAVRLSIRAGRERTRRPAVRRIDTLALIVGAGQAGIRLFEEIERRRLRLAVVGFVDDDPAKRGLRVCGCPVLGGADDIPALVGAHDIGEVLIAIPSISGARLRRIVQHCTKVGVRHRVLPTLGELVEGRVMYTQMREVRVEDLLGREPVRLDVARVRALVAARTVLVTGAAGSIGSELCRQVAAHGPRRLVLFDRHENGVFNLEMELRARFPQLPIEPILGDVLLPDQLRAVFGTYRPEVVFHAAAYKHLPMAERNVLEAARNNVLGTRNVAEAAIAHGTREFVQVSTDKAVRPTSVMGATKRVAEMVVQGLQNGGCRFVVVRFGNVLGSSGSVVPLFKEQIARGGPVTVTDPEVTRYFMTIPEAAQLILQAATLGQGGEIFVLEMGQPIRILDLARHMISLAGFTPEEDIPIVFTGLRPGEKLHEELVAEEEEIASTAHDRIRVLRSSGPDPALASWLGRLEGALAAADVPRALALLQEMVPTYHPSAHAAADAEHPARPSAA